MKLIVQRHRITNRLRPNHKIIETLSLPQSYHHITKDLFIVVPFTWYILYGYQGKITNHNKRQKKTKCEAEQDAETDIAVILELPGQEFKIIDKIDRI